MPLSHSSSRDLMAGGTEAMSFAHLKNNTKSRWWHDPCLRKNVFHCVGLYFCVFYLGFDASLLNGLQDCDPYLPQNRPGPDAMPQWKQYFNNPSGNYLGLISASLFLPAIVTPYFSSAVNSRFGRKAALAIGSIILIIGAFINAFAVNAGMFIAGRVLIGAAGPFGKTTAIALLQEIAHPRLRPILSVSFYSNYYVGSAIAAWFCYGSLGWGATTWSWRAPCLFQIFAPSIVLIHLLFVPESPRWLIHKERPEEALAILARSHANGDSDDELVRYEYREIRLALRLEAENKKTSYMDFLRTAGNRRRLLVLITIATGTNWIGNGIISYYLAPVLKLVGITDPHQVSGINGGLALWNLILAYTGSLNAERVGRRKLWLWSTAGMLASYVAMTGLSGSFAQTGNRGVGIAVVPVMFIYYGWYDIGWTPLPFSYAGELLPYHLRLRGLSILLSVQSVAQAFNQWVNPVALASIAWKYYIVYLVLISMYLVLIWFFFPETKGLTLEEVSVIFDHGRLGTARAAVGKFQQQQEHVDGSSSSGVVDQKADVAYVERRDNV